jgi:hypothetical protein
MNWPQCPDFPAQLLANLSQLRTGAYAGKVLLFWIKKRASFILYYLLTIKPSLYNRDLILNHLNPLINEKYFFHHRDKVLRPLGCIFDELASAPLNLIDKRTCYLFGAWGINFAAPVIRRWLHDH